MDKPNGRSSASPDRTGVPFPDLRLELSENCSVSKMTAAGELLYLYIGPASTNCEQILVIDGKGGDRLGTIDVRP